MFRLYTHKRSSGGRCETAEITTVSDAEHHDSVEQNYVNMLAVGLKMGGVIFA
jgi:hypothetical protein